MPFDPARVTVLPPSLREPQQPPVVPERGDGGGPRRVHIEIIVHLPAPPRRRRPALWWWLVALLLIALAAHARPVQEWPCYPFGNGENCHGADQHGRECRSRSYEEGDTTYTTRPDGPERRCSAARYTAASDAELA
jgi:hypothetical protein